MSDDEIIMLWMLDGMEFWGNLSSDMIDSYLSYIIRLSSRRNPLFQAYVTFHHGDSGIAISRANEYLLTAKYVEVIYVIQDIFSFNPDEKWWKLLVAKYWYSKNKHRFSDE